MKTPRDEVIRQDEEYSLFDGGTRFYAYRVTDSTNLRARALANEGYTGRALFLANEQTAGRGRNGRSFYSPNETGLYMSYLFSASVSPEIFGAVTSFAAVAVCRAIEECVPALSGRMGIKWVNDLFLDGKKVCGILAEAIVRENDTAVIIGVGINLTTEVFPDGLEKTAGALGALPEKERLAQKIAETLSRFADDPLQRSYMKEYTERSVVLNKKVILDRWGEKVEGTVCGFDENGGLLLDTGKGVPELCTGGEISLRLV